VLMSAVVSSPLAPNLGADSSRGGVVIWLHTSLKHGLWLAAVIDLLCIGLVQGAEGLKPLQLISCRPSSSLRQVLALLATHSLHRLHILDACQRPVGIVTITDLLRVIVGATELLEAVQPVSAMGR